MSLASTLTATALVALLACAASADRAEAYDLIDGGGSTLANTVYRALMDTWEWPNNTDASDGCGTTSLDLSGRVGMFDYVAVGSGFGKQALLNHNPTTSATLGLGPDFPVQPVPCPPITSPFFRWTGLDNYHFAAAEDVITPTDLATYAANSGPANWGKLIQVPAFVAPIDIIVNTTNLNEDFSGINLTRQQLCGIFSGHITDWADPIFAQSGLGGRPLTVASIAITVFHIGSNDGTTFLLSNALREQCAGIVGPNNAFNGDNTPSLWEFDWTDRTVPANACPALPSRAASGLNWPDHGTDQCGSTIAKPGGSSFLAGSGAQNSMLDEVCGVSKTVGAIGYASPQYTSLHTHTINGCSPAPAATWTAPSAVNLQNQYGVDNDPPNGPYTFVNPSPAAAAAAVAAATPNFPDDATLTNPLNWGTQGLVPNPDDPNAYPIAGFSWLDFYQCYRNPSSDGDIPGAIHDFLVFLYGGTNPGTAAAILNQNGFATIPAAWGDSVANLLLNSSSRFGIGGAGVCAGIPGA